MKKKLLSALLAFSLLGQSAFAATNLGTYVNGSSITDSYIDSSGRFDWSLFATQNPMISIPAVIPAKITTTVRKDGATTFTGHHTTSTVLSSLAPSENVFDFNSTLNMTDVKAAFEELYNTVNNAIEFDSAVTGDITDASTDKGALWQQFLNSTVVGTFEVDLTFDDALDLDPAATFILMQNSAVSTVFVEATPPTLNSTSAKFVYTTKPGLTVSELYASRVTYLSDLSMTIEDVTANVQDTVIGVDVSMTNASIEAFDATNADPAVSYAIVKFTSPSDDLSAAYVKVPSTVVTPPTGGGGGSTSLVPKAYTVVDGEKASVEVTKDGTKYYVDVDGITDPVKEGYIFDGWYLDTGLTNPAEGKFNITRTTYLYAKFTPISKTAPTAHTVVDDVKEPVEVKEADGKYVINIDEIAIPEKDGFAFDGWYLDPYYLSPASGEIEITEDTHLYAKLVSTSVPHGLISDHHIAYIFGYPDGEVKPNGLITREEVAAAFYRLLEPSYRATIETTEHQFPDVEADRWSNEEIATLANGGYIVGDENGNFNPAAPITRAEFVTIANKFEQLETVPATNYFSDITGHWAEEAILSATNGHHWITGYEDGTFRPNNSITRAEAMTIINHMLVRYCDIESELAKVWPDVSESDWYYENVTEATTEHDFERDTDGWHEHWIGASTNEATDTVADVADETSDEAVEAQTEEVTE